MIRTAEVPAGGVRKRWAARAPYGRWSQAAPGARQRTADAGKRPQRSGSGHHAMGGVHRPCAGCGARTLPVPGLRRRAEPGLNAVEDEVQPPLELGVEVVVGELCLPGQRRIEVRPLVEVSLGLTA